MTREFWESRYAEPGHAYGTRPNRFLEQMAAHWPAGLRVLVPGDGEGRNGVWLARQGQTVLAVDQAQAGLDKARALAAQQGVSLETQAADLLDWEPPAAAFDALVLIYLHLPPEHRGAVHARLLTALRPGARVLLEGFDRRHFGLPGGGPRDPAWLFTEADLRADFGALQDLRIETVDTELDEGPCHRGAARVIRLQGRWPG